MKFQATKASRENAEITSQLQFLRSQSNRTDPQISDLNRKLDNLEREKEKANDKLNSCKVESDRKDTLIEGTLLYKIDCFKAPSQEAQAVNQTKIS